MKHHTLSSALKTLIAGGLCSSLACASSLAADIYWDGSNNNLWSSAANWSTSSSGGGSATVPGASDDAILTATGAANLSISTTGASRAVNSLSVNSTVSSDVTININDSGAADRTFRIQNGLTVASGVTGNFTITDGGGDDDIVWGITTAASGSNAVTNNSTTALLTLAATQKYVGSGAATNTIVYGGVGNITVSGQILSVSPGARTLHILKEGAGTLTLSNSTNDYNGTTSINGGTLLLSGGGRMGTGNVELGGGSLDISAISAASYSLTSTQTLSGQGTILATGKTLSVAGNLNPGTAGVGALTVNGGFTLENTAIANFDLNGVGGGQFDSLVVNGLLTVDGTLNLVTNFSVSLNQSIQILDFDSISGTFDLITGTNLGGGLFWDTSSLYSTGVITAVPEPATVQILLLSAGVMFFLFRRRRSLS